MLGQHFPLLVATLVVAAGFGGTSELLEQLVAAAKNASQESSR